jgi:hypothetical protein
MRKSGIKGERKGDRDQSSVHISDPATTVVYYLSPTAFFLFVIVGKYSIALHGVLNQFNFFFVFVNMPLITEW